MADLEPDKLTDAQLTKWSNQFMQSWINAKAEGKDEAVINAYMKGYNDCETERATREAREATTTVTFSQSEQLAIKDMRAYFTDSVSVFGPGTSCPIFISQVENGYKMHVGTNTKFELTFCKQVKAKLCQAYLSQVNESGQSLGTWSELKVYLKKQHASKETIFQLLDEPWNMELDGSICDFGVKLENSINEAMISLEDKFTSSSKTLNTKSLADVLGGYLLLRQVRQRHPDAFNNTVTTLDSCYSISDVVEKVRAFTDRVGGEESATSSAFHATRGSGHRRGGGRGGYRGGARGRGRRDGGAGGGRKHDKKEPNVCWNSRDRGTCRRQNCPYDNCVGDTTAAAGGDGGGVGHQNTGFFTGPDFPNTSLPGARK